MRFLHFRNRNLVKTAISLAGLRKTRHKFLTKTPDNVHQSTVRHAVQRVSSHPFHPVWALWKAPVRVAQEVIGGGDTNADDVPVPY